MPTASTRSVVNSRLLALTVVASLTAVQPFRAQAAAGRQAPAPSAVDSARLMADVRALSAPEMGGRATGTEGNKAARAIIVQRFRALRLKPVGVAFEHPFSFTRQNTTRAGVNVIGLVEGTVERDRYTLVSAHYDHLGTRDGTIFHGADDNASGVAGLLAAAAWFKTHPPGRSLLVVAFDAEENGLQGARQLVAQPPVDLKAIDLVINMDMIGRGDANTLYVAGTSHYPQLKARVEALARGRSIEVAFGHDRKVPGAPPSDDWTMASDHGPFHSAGIPFLYFGVEDHPDYHKPTDTADRIPVAFFVEAVKLVIDTIAAFSDASAAAVRPAQSGSLSAEEAALVAYVDAHNGEALALLERVVNINSGSMNFEGVREVGRVFRQELDGLGFTTRWVDGAAFGRAGHLVADRPGPGPRILLIGHLDTVFEPDSPFQRFERIDARSARGPGIIDMKGGNVVMLQALKALHAAGALTSMNVTVVMTGDEELTGEPLGAAREALVSAAKGAAIALGFENGPGNPRTAVIARRGTTGWQLRVKARPAHSSQIFREDIGAGAIYEAARILTVFREQLAGEPHLTFNPGLILGGTAVDYDAPQSRGTASGKENVIAEHAVVAGDLRTLSKEQLEAAKKRMEAITAASLPHTQATITFDEGYPPLAPTDGNRTLLGLYDQASRDVGAGAVGPVDPDRAGAADVSFVAGEVPRILDGIGLMGTNDHTPQETADLTTLPSQAKRAAVLLYRLSRGAARRTP